MTADEFIDVLFDGTRDQMDALENMVSPGSRYEYSKELDSMRVYFGSETHAMHGIPEVPNCVPLLGASHTFGKAPV